MNQEKIGKLIKSLRLEKNMTQQELSEKIGVTDRAISKWENGRGMPEISLLIPLSDVLGISVLELLNGEKIENENNALIDIIKHQDKKMKIWKYLFMSVANIGLLFMMIITVFGFVIPLIYENSNNKGITRVLSESMNPTLKSNDGIVYNKVNIDKVKKDDIVVFYYMNDEGALLANGYLVHRVVYIMKDNKGNINLLTRGDNNLEDDKQYVTSKNFVGVYKHKTSKLTSLFLENKVLDCPIILIICSLGIINTLCLDIIQIKKYLNSK